MARQEADTETWTTTVCRQEVINVRSNKDIKQILGPGLTGKYDMADLSFSVQKKVAEPDPVEPPPGIDLLEDYVLVLKAGEDRPEHEGPRNGPQAGEAP